MSRELTRRVEDLERALRIIRQVAADAALTPKRRLDQIVGITKMHADDEPAAVSEAAPPGGNV